MRVQAEVRLTFTLEICKHGQKQMTNIAWIFFNLAMKIEIRRWSKKWENWVIFEIRLGDRERVKKIE